VFDSREVGLAERATGSEPTIGVGVTELRELAGKVAPVVLAGEQLLVVDDLVAPLLPAGALRRGTVVSVEGAAGSGATSLLFRLVAGASRAGSWVAMVGMQDLGVVAAAEAGIDLSRCAVVPEPGGNWPMVTAALLDAIDVVVLRPSTRVRPQDARRLATRARDRGGVLIAAGGGPPPNYGWPEGADIRLRAERSRWVGLSDGHGFLRERVVDVVAGGRGAAARQRRREVSV
jgi:hypothetical protein